MRAEGLQFLVLVVCSCGVSGLPATTSVSASTSSSAGTKVAAQVDADMETVSDNLYKGVTAVADPLLKFGVDTVPNLVHLYALANGVNVPPAIASLAKDIARHAMVAGGSLAGSAAVLGSSVAKDAADVAGTALDTKYKIMAATAEAALKVADSAADRLIESGSLATDLATRGLNVLGDGMQTAGASVNILSLGIARIFQAIGERLASSIASAEKAVAALSANATALLTGGANQLSNNGLARFYLALNNYVSFLNNTQSMFDTLVNMIDNTSASTSVQVSI